VFDAALNRVLERRDQDQASITRSPPRSKEST
jgi:hypothetical protein